MKMYDLVRHESRQTDIKSYEISSLQRNLTVKLHGINQAIVLGFKRWTDHLPIIELLIAISLVVHVSMG
jgi:hypothetical protein